MENFKVYQKISEPKKLLYVDRSRVFIDSRGNGCYEAYYPFRKNDIWLLKIVLFNKTYEEKKVG